MGDEFKFAGGVVAFLIALPVIYAYIRHVRSRSPLERHMSIGIVCLVGAYGLRTFYWDSVKFFIGDNWDAWYAATGEDMINNVFNALFVYGVYRSLLAVALMVDPVDQPDWPWWRAWLYPPRRIADWWFRKDT